MERCRAAEVDWNYATYFPWERRYVALFKGEEEDEERGGICADRGDGEVRARIKRAMGEGTASLEAIRCELTVVQRAEGKRQSDDGGRRKDDGGMVEGDEESDGGFFE
jgi:hypothetical protein